MFKMITGSTFSLLVEISKMSGNPLRDRRLMAQNLKLLLKLNKRVATKIELSKLEKLRVGTNEIEMLAKKMMTRDMKRKRNVKNVMIILKNRLKTFLNQQKYEK